MKKIAAILLILVLVFSLSACNNATVPSYSAKWGAKGVNEVSTYSVSVVASGEDRFDGAPRLTGQGTYISTVQGGPTTFTLTTEYNFVGKYTLSDGSEVPVDDRIVTSTAFSNISLKFAPISSTKTYVGSTITYKDDVFSITPLDYQSTVNYREKNAQITVASLDEDGKYTEQVSNVPIERSISYKTVPYDNEQFALVLRSLNLNTEFNSSITMLNPLMSSTLTMAISVGTTTSELIQSVNGEMTAFNCYIASLRNSSTDEGGSPLLMYYAANDLGEVYSEAGELKGGIDRTRLIRMEQNVPYSNDTFLFELKTYEYNKAE